jgi:hypothetical protein
LKTNCNDLWLLLRGFNTWAKPGGQIFVYAIGLAVEIESAD